LQTALNLAFIRVLLAAALAWLRARVPRWCAWLVVIGLAGWAGYEFDLVEAAPPRGVRAGGRRSGGGDVAAAPSMARRWGGVGTKSFRFCCRRATRCAR
jgi:hypothetical protein